MKDRIFPICDIVRETGFALHSYLGPGHLEKVYERGLLHRLQKQCLGVIPQQQFMVLDQDGTDLGEFYADLFVENQLIIEIKAARSFAPEHVAQLLGYMRAGRIEHGLLINFGAAKFEIKKYVLSQPDTHT